VKIQVVQDLICPWCYIGHHNLEQAISEVSADGRIQPEIEWLPYQLDPLEEGAAPEDFRERFKRRKGVTDEQMNAMFDKVTAAGAAVGIEFRYDRVKVAPDTIPGHIAIAATPPAKQSALVNALHRANFTDGKDIGQESVLEEAARTAGLDDAEVSRMLQAVRDPQARREIQDLIQQVQAAGITGVPFTIVDNQYGLSGGQPVEVFRQAIEQAAAASVR
jgi:predicted DsbA family dithiol-disulfide isomerase